MNEQLHNHQKKRSRCYPIQAPIEYRVHGERIWHHGVSRNISDSEIVFETDCELQQGAQFEAHISLPAIANQRIAISFQATVVRSLENGMWSAHISVGRLCRSLQSLPPKCRSGNKCQSPAFDGSGVGLTDSIVRCERPDAFVCVAPQPASAHLQGVRNEERPIRWRE